MLHRKRKTLRNELRKKNEKSSISKTKAKSAIVSVSQAKIFRIEGLERVVYGAHLVSKKGSGVETRVGQVSD